MIRHVAVFTFVPEFSAMERAEWIAMVRALPDSIPQVLALSIGEDVVHGPASHELAIVADFASLRDLEAYSSHPAHTEVLAVSAGVKVSLAVVDFEL
jgi:hypothetical protein